MKLRTEKDDARDSIVEFYSQLPVKYSELSFKQVNEICRAPWKFLKKQMYNGEFEEVRLQYFGVFRVRLGQAKHQLKSIKERFKKGTFAPEIYFPLKKNLENFLIKNGLDPK